MAVTKKNTKQTNAEKFSVTILIVDDEPESLMTLSEMLSDKRYDIRPAVSGQSALEAVKQYLPDLILLDVNLPDMEGFEVCRKLKAWKRSSGIPIIFLMMATDAVDKSEGLRIGGADFIARPCDSWDLLTRVNNHLAIRQLKRELAERNQQLKLAREDFEGVNAGMEDRVQKRMAELVATNQALYQSEKKLRALSDNSFQLTGLLDSEGRVLMANKTSLDFAGITEDDVLGKIFWQTAWWDYDPDIQAQCRDAVERARQGELVRMEVMNRAGDGNERLVDFSIKPVFDDNGRLLYMVPEGRDITEKQEFVDTLEKYEHLVSTSKDMMALVDYRLVYQACSNAYAEMYARKREQVIGSTVVEVIGEEMYQNHARQHIEDVFLGKDMQEQFWFTFPGDRRRFLDITLYPHRAKQSGRIEGFVVSMRDMTALKGLEEQLRRAQKLESLGTLAGGIAHDFNNILSPILGYAEISMMDADEGSDLYGFQKEIVGAARRAQDLVSQILTFCHQTEQVLQPVQPRLIVKEALKLLRATLPATIDIKQQLYSDALIMGDPTQIHQVVMNLGTNAAHAMRQNGGTLTVRLTAITDEQIPSNVKLRHIQSGDYLKLSVQDTGHGISEEIRESIFDPYFTAKAQGEGTGLGLSIVHSIVSAYDGAVDVSSYVGQGTIFDIYLPAVGKENQEDNTIERSLPKGREHILVVDDEPVIANMVKRMLNRQGYQVSIHQNSTEALTVIKADIGRFDLVLTDLAMPGMSGLRLAQEIALHRTDLPVVLMTGYMEMFQQKQIQDAGIAACIKKPVTIQKIAEAVREVLDAHLTDGSGGGRYEEGI